MKRVTLFLMIFLLCHTTIVAEESFDGFILAEKGLRISVISQDISAEELNSVYNSPTTVDNSGNFYYCISEGNPNGYLWIIKKVDKATGRTSEICRLNLDKYKIVSIRAINCFGNSLYAWCSFVKSGSKGWFSVLVEITGL